MTGPDPRRVAVCERARQAVNALLTDAIDAAGVGRCEVADAIPQFTGRATVEQLAVALDLLGYDLVLTATAQDTPAESEAV